MTDQSFNGRAVIVTGGGTGIGQATAWAFAAQGADVLIVGRTAARLAETAADQPRIRPLVADLADPDAAQRITDTAIDTFGRIDVLVHNAGIVRQVEFGNVRPADAQDLLATNLLAPVYLTDAALPHLTRTAGVIVNVSTAIGQRGWPMPGGALYAAAKSALESLTRSWAVQLAPQGIRVAAVAPGPIATPISQHQGLTPEQSADLRDTLINFVPLRRIGQPEEVAFWIVQLARPEAGFTTGIVLPVDGGAVIS